ncbi:MAG TPA: FAD-binding oxidoreductase [Polyangia bacterium]|jgi:sarcosine oxidase subunit beta
MKELTPTVGPPKRSCAIAIVGGGVMGLSIAYQLARRGLTDVVVLERGYLAQGASGRNGGGVRMQWSTELNVRLMQESIELCRHFAQEIGVNVWFRQGGYLFLATREAEREKMERNVALQNRVGVPTRMLSPEEARAIVPELDVSRVVCACYNPKDGVLFPWPFLWGYAHQALARGVEVHLFTEVSAIERSSGGFLLHTSKGPVKAERVVNAAGAWSPQIARLVGVELPDRPHRHEILSTEPLKPFLTPMVSVLSSGLYFSQSMRGEIVTGITVEDHDDDQVKMGSRLKFLTTLARELVRVMPRLADVKILRQWAGPYDVSPDGAPILGEPPGVPGFYLACGFGGHGFMMSPVIGELYAEWLTSGRRHQVFDESRLDRFSKVRPPGGNGHEELIIG